MKTVIKSMSILFPVYNDKETIETMVNKSQGLIEKFNIPSEIIIVNDGCKFGSGEEAERLAKKHNNIVVINNLNNEGYGAAIKKGIKAAKYDWILQTDGDNQYDLNDFHQMNKIIHNYDCLITFRYKKIYESHRIFISWFYNKLIQFIFKSNFRDVSTGLRLIKKKSLKDVDLISNSSFIGAEIAVRLMLKGYQVGEMGIITYPRKFGMSSIITIRSIIETVKDLVKLKLHLFK